MAHAQEIDILLDAIGDAQDTNRAFDLKAEILTAILTLVVAIVTFAGHDTTAHGLLLLAEILAVGSVLLALGFLACVLYPTNDPIEQVKKGTFSPSGTYYLNDATLTNESVSDVAKKVANTSWTDELVYELMKVSSIRKRKNKYFTKAMWASVAAFVLLVAVCAARFI